MGAQPNFIVAVEHSYQGGSVSLGKFLTFTIGNASAVAPHPQHIGCTLAPASDTIAILELTAAAVEQDEDSSSTALDDLMEASTATYADGPWPAHSAAYFWSMVSNADKAKLVKRLAEKGRAFVDLM